MGSSLLKWLASITGAILILLGALWLLQGTVLVTIAPIACVADCETRTGPSLPWALAGAVALAAGTGLIWFSLFRRRS